jgi:hypothetical protein
MSESEIFYFEVTGSNWERYPSCVKAPNLQTAKDCIENQSNVVSARPIEESDIPNDVREKLGEPIECEQQPAMRVGYAQSEWPK